jgi:peptide/nickel transport system ATP-binding protein
VQPKCIAEEPPLIDAAEHGHVHRCWFPVGTPEGRAALEANQNAGVESAIAMGAA